MGNSDVHTLVYSIRQEVCILSLFSSIVLLFMLVYDKIAQVPSTATDRNEEALLRMSCIAPNSTQHSFSHGAKSTVKHEPSSELSRLLGE